MERQSPRPTPRYAETISRAAEIAAEMDHSYVGVEHLFLAVLSDPRAVPTQVLERHISARVIEARLVREMESDPYNTPTLKIADPNNLLQAG
jgi:ATP-dependent Clp protease ATP-binding subunit ClpA